MVYRRALLVLVVTILVLSTVHAVDYELYTQESGKTVVLAQIQEKGTFDIKLPSDAQPLVRGALYIVNDQQITLSVGSTEKATLAYQTDQFTTKSEDAWQVSFQANDDDKLTLHLPKNVQILKTTDNAVINSGSITKIEGKGALDIKYKYTDVELEPFITGKQKENLATKLTILIIVIGALVIGGISYFALRSMKTKQLIETTEKVDKNRNKSNLVKTLSENEKSIVQLMMDNGDMKRSDLERKASIAKSSLASTLHQLERKNIVTVDRTYTSHFVRFTKWFTDL